MSTPLRTLVAAAAAVVAILVALDAFWLEPASLRVRRHTLAVPGWPEADRGLRIALLSDLHVGSAWNGPDKLRRIVTFTNAARPDLILLAGDFVTRGTLGAHYVAPEEIGGILRGLRAPFGVYAVLGNHDFAMNAPRITGALEMNGITVLNDRAVRLPAGGPATRFAPFWLVGVTDFLRGPHDLRKALGWVDDEAPVILLTHNPDIFPEVPARVNLTLAGHTHGGQVYLPFFGRPIVPSAYGERYAAGEVVERGRHLFVTTGLGTSILPVRFLVPPEIALLSLEPAPGG